METAIKDPTDSDYFIKDPTTEYVTSVVEDGDEYLAASVFYVPPFNMKDWGAERVAGDVRLKFGQPPNS